MGVRLRCHRGYPMIELRLEHVCYPCYYGAHSCCRHRPHGRQYEQGPAKGPCQCEKSGHTMGADSCASRVRGDSRWPGYNDRCNKPAKGSGRSSYLGHRREGDPDEVVPLCGVHLAAQRRVADNDARRTAEYQARTAKEEDRDRAMTQASADWAARLRDEFQVPASGLACRNGELQVAVQPEQLYAVLDAAAGALRDMGLDWAELVTENVAHRTSP